MDVRKNKRQKKGLCADGQVSWRAEVTCGLMNNSDKLKSLNVVISRMIAGTQPLHGKPLCLLLRFGGGYFKFLAAHTFFFFFGWLTDERFHSSFL